MNYQNTAWKLQCQRHCASMLDSSRYKLWTKNTPEHISSSGKCHDSICKVPCNLPCNKNTDIKSQSKTITNSCHNSDVDRLSKTITKPIHRKTPPIEAIIQQWRPEYSIWKLNKFHKTNMRQQEPKFLLIRNLTGNGMHWVSKKGLVLYKLRFRTNHFKY